MIAKKIKIGEISHEVTKGTTPTTLGFDYKDSGIPFIRATNLGEKYVNFKEDVLYIDQEANKALGRSVLLPGDLLISIAGTIGELSIVPDDAPLLNCNQAVCLIRLKDTVDRNYLRHWFSSIDAKKQIQNSKVTGVISNLSLGQIKNLELALPTLEEQRRIAAILDKAEALRSKRREAIAKLDQLLQSVFLEMFDVKDSGWAEVNVGDITDVQGGLQLSAAREKIENKKPYLRVANVYRNRLDLSEIKYFGVTDSEFLRTKLEKNDILIVEGHGNPDEIGRSAIWDGSVKDCTHQNHLIRCRINKNKVLPEYLNFYMNSDLGKFHLKKSSNTTSGLNTISVSKVRSLPVILAPIDEQKKWVNFQNKIEKMKNLHKAQLKFNDSLIYSLQSQYFQR